MMEGQSFGSNYYHTSQSRKVSIGVLVDSVANSKSKNIKELEVEKITPSKGNCLRDGIDGEGFSPIVEKHTVEPEQDISPWISVRSLNQKIPTSVPVKEAEHTPSFPSTCERRKRSKGLKEVSAVHSVQFFVGKTTALQSDEDKQKTVGKATYTRKVGKKDDADNVESLSVTGSELIPYKGLAEGKTNKSETGGSETLKMKLWEILGNVPSPNKEGASFLPVSTCSKDRYPDHESKREGSPAGKTRQNSDTIESDSERPDHAARRPLTRSFTQKKKKGPTKMHKAGTSKCTYHRKGYTKKNVLSLGGERSVNLFDTADGLSLPFKRKKSERKSLGVDNVDSNLMCFHECKKSERQQSENKGKSIPFCQKSTSDGNNITATNIPFDERNGITVKKASGNNKIFTEEYLLTTTTEQLKDVVGSPKTKDLQQDFAHSVLQNRMGPNLDPQSPTFEIKSPTRSSSPVSPPGSNQGKHHDQSPAQRIYRTSGVESFKSLFHLNHTQNNSNAQPESSDDSGELKESPIMNSRSSLEKDVENRMSSSPSDEMETESSEENSQLKGCMKSELFSDEIVSPKNQEFVRRQSELLFNQEGVELSGFCPASKSFKGVEETRKFQSYFEQNQEDGFVSSVALIATTVDRVKTKMKSAASKKAAEILRSAVEGIQLQLRNAESQIKTDLGKVTGLSKSKRTSLGTRFEEQQEKLHDIYKRFKAEIDQHNVDYKSLIEDLEEHKMELKRTLEKQRTAHNRLLLQGKQTIDIRFKDAQSRITAVQNRAKEKMLQLKLVIAECVKEGAFS